MKAIGKKKRILIFLTALMIQTVLTGCRQNKKETQDFNIPSHTNEIQDSKTPSNEKEITEENRSEDNKEIMLDTKLQELEEGLSAIHYEGKDGFDEFLAGGGASSDREVVNFLTVHFNSELSKLQLGSSPFGCSTISVKNENKGYLFGRNFDWSTCKALVISSQPETGYASISTVNTEFIQTGGLDLSTLSDTILAVIGLYAPLDGMNETGLAVSVNMIEDSDTIEQTTDKPDLTTTTAIRLLLNQAATVEEALELLEQYDLHASMGRMIHFSIADADGNSVVVEYVNNKMIVTETPIVTNFYFAEGEKYGIGTSQSHLRYDILEQTLKENETMNMRTVRDALNSVSKDNFNEFESTEWSIVMNQDTKEMTYYHRENYEKGYTFRIK